MMFEENVPLTRRTLLTRAAIGALGIALLPHTMAAGQSAPPNPNEVPFKLGLQSHSLRKFSLDEMLTRTQDLGLHYLEGFPGHFPITDDPRMIADYRQKLHGHNIRMIAYGVVELTADEADARHKLAFANAMGVRTVSATLKADAIPVLDKLVDEYKVNVAVCNQGPGETYDEFEKLLAALNGHNPRIGACIDTAKYLMTNESPLSAGFEFIKQNRLYDIHLANLKEDENGKKQVTEIGVTGGLLDTVAIFRMLKDHSYNGLVALDYDAHESDPMSYLQQSVAATRNYVNTVKNVGLHG